MKIGSIRSDTIEKTAWLYISKSMLNTFYTDDFTSALFKEADRTE